MATSDVPVVPVCSICRRKDGAGHKMSCPVSKYGVAVKWVDKFTNRIIKDVGEV